MSTEQQPIESEKLTGISKRINKELEDLPFASHAAIVGILGVLIQHRQSVERGKQEEQARRAQLASQFAVPSAMVPQ
jgi:hypothetical protein